MLLNSQNQWVGDDESHVLQTSEDASRFLRSIGFHDTELELDFGSGWAPRVRMWVELGRVGPKGPNSG